MANNNASDLLEQGIMSTFKSTEDYEEDDMLVDWIVIAYTDNPNNGPGIGGIYPMLFSNGSMPRYKAIGLITNGIGMLEDDEV